MTINVHSCNNSCHDCWCKQAKPVHLWTHPQHTGPASAQEWVWLLHTSAYYQNSTSKCHKCPAKSGSAATPKLSLCWTARHAQTRSSIRINPAANEQNTWSSEPWLTQLSSTPPLAALLQQCKSRQDNMQIHAIRVSCNAHPSHPST